MRIRRAEVSDLPDLADVFVRAAAYLLERYRPEQLGVISPVVLRAARHAAAGPVTFAVPSTNWAAIGELVRAAFAPFGTNMFMASRPIGDGSRYLSSGGALG